MDTNDGEEGNIEVNDDIKDDAEETDDSNVKANQENAADVDNSNDECANDLTVKPKVSFRSPHDIYSGLTQG